MGQFRKASSQPTLQSGDTHLHWRMSQIMQRGGAAASSLAARIHFPPWDECMRSERTAAAAASDKEAEWRDGGSVEFRPSGAVQRNGAQKHMQVAAAVGNDAPSLGSGDHSAAATTVTGSIGSCSRSEGISMRSSSNHSGIDNRAPLFDSLSPVGGVAHWSHRSQGSGEQQLLHSMRELSRPLTTHHALARARSVARRAHDIPVHAV